MPNTVLSWKFLSSKHMTEVKLHQKFSVAYLNVLNSLVGHNS